MLLLQEAALPAQQAAHGAVEAAAHGALHPWAPWLILLLPLLGFLLNGALSIVAARRALPKLPPVGDPHYDHDPSEQEHHAHGDPAHPAEQDHAHNVHDNHGHDAPGHGGARPFTHTLPSLIAPGVMLLAFLVAAYNWVLMYGFTHSTEHPAFEATPLWSWMPVGDLQVDIALLLDPLSMLMTLIITGVGFLIHVFSIGYMKEDPGYPRYMAYLNLFVFFMLILVLGSSYPLMFVGWEGVGLASYLLIGFWFKEKANADAGKKAFIVNRIGDFGFLMGMFLLWVHTGTLNFAPSADGELSAFGVISKAIADPTWAVNPNLLYGSAVLTAIALFFFLGAAGKSAQIPLYVWLPDAMAGPTPVSALIHAATMVTAGVYLVVRSSVIFTAAPAASLTVAVVGALTAIFAASIGLKQWDIKKVLAYSTVSQLGFMFAAVGMGAYVAGVFHLMTHAFFKACLFLGSGAVIHAMHGALHATHSHADPQDMRNMGGLKKYLPITFATMAIATLAIAGVPPFAGFFSKDEIIGAAWLGAEGHSSFSDASWLGIPGSYVMLFVGVTLSIAAFMTAFYMGRMMLYTFFGRFRGGETEERHLHEGGPTLSIPLIVLAVLSTVGGFLNVEDVPIVNWFDFGQGAALHHWLHPVIAGSEDVIRANFGEAAEPPHHAWPIILAIVIGLGGLALSYFLLSRRNLRDASAEPAYDNGVEKTLYNKWYIDELYDRVVVRNVNRLSRAQSNFDRYVVDGMVDFTGRMAQWIGLGAGRLQSGHLNTYAFMVIVGVLVVLGTFVL